MSNNAESITILRCHNDNSATKKFICHEDGTIEKRSFSAGIRFKYEEKPVSGLDDLSEILEELANQPKKLVIRGKPKEKAGEIVRRKIREPDAAFDPAPRSYVMLDIDKQECPDFFDASENPDEIVEWVQKMLPEPFWDVSCYYQFSSSQNVPKKIGQKPQSKISIHLWFWLDRAISDQEWKQYYKNYPAPVDCALFSPVQIHYTANPIFENMDDPLPDRSGIFKGKRDVVHIPEIQIKEQTYNSSPRPDEPEVSEEDRQNAIEFLAPYYQDGQRNRLCGAVAATLYRGGWNVENAADFILSLAEHYNDPEAMERYNNVARICEAVDENLPAQGIPTLDKEFEIKNLDEFLALLGVGKPDIGMAIARLHEKGHDHDAVKEVLKLLLPLPEGEKKVYLDRIKKQTELSKPALKALLEDVEIEESKKEAIDWADLTIKLFLREACENGRYLLRADDKNYWQYNGKFWSAMSKDFLKSKLLPYVEKVAKGPGRSILSPLQKSVLELLPGKVYQEGDPLRFKSSDVPSVINCRNGELWFDDEGDVTFKPHRAESYLQHYLDVDYNPSAECPMFDQAVKEIFACSSDPEDMFRHFMELVGYICQPWRKLATIVLLHGRGNNGKTSLMQITIKLVGAKMVMSDRISDIESSIFKIGALNGKLMLMDDDVDEGTCLPDGFVKKISEEKTMTGQHKHKPSFDFICRTVPVLLANNYPAIKDLSDGTKRRIMIIPFARKFEKHEVRIGLFDRIWEQEASGILKQAIAGFCRLKKRGGFNIPADCEKAKEDWLLRSNILLTFIDEMCEKDVKQKQSLGDFYNDFKMYCSEAGVRNTMGRHGLEKRLESLGYNITILDGKKVVRGIATTKPTDFEPVTPEVDLRDKK